jgi:hypothetical protein
MTTKRIVLATLAAFAVSQVLAGYIHGFILDADYGPYYGTLLRSGDQVWQSGSQSPSLRHNAQPGTTRR